MAGKPKSPKSSDPFARIRASFGGSIPPRITEFFDSGSAKALDGRFAHGLIYHNPNDKLIVGFSPDGAAKIIEDNNGADFPDRAKYLPLATVGKKTGDLCFVVDPASPELPVLMFEHEAGFHPFATSFEAFLAGLLVKGAKAPLEVLEDVRKKADKLHAAKKPAAAVALLEPALITATAAVRTGESKVDDELAASHNLLGLALQELARIDDATRHFEIAVTLGDTTAGLNLCELYLDHFKDPARTITYAEDLKLHVFRRGDYYEWFHVRNYLGRAYVLTGAELQAVRTYHELRKEFLAKDAAKLAQAVADLKAITGPHAAIAKRILDWFDRPIELSTEQAAGYRAWWKRVGPELGAKLREAAGIGDDPAPSDHELARIAALTILWLGKSGLTDLSVLAPFQQLDYLMLDGNPALELATLPRLRALASLHVSECGLTSLGRLGDQVPALTELSCGENALVSLQGIETLPRLRLLDARENRITSLEPARGRAELEELTIYGNPIADFSPLDGCKRLAKLSFHEPTPGLGDFPWLKPETSHAVATAPDRAWWKELSTEWKKRFSKSDRKNLANLIAADTRRFTDHQLTDLTPIKHLTNIRFLVIERNAITDLTPVAGLPSLRQLWARANQLASLAPLRIARHLEQLHVPANRITSLAGLDECLALRDLDSSDNALDSLEPLRRTSALRVLAVGGNRVTSLEPLAALTSLQVLDVSQNQVRDLGVLAGCRELEVIECYANPGLTGLLALAPLASLRVVTSHGSLDAKSIAKFRARRPDVVID